MANRVLERGTMIEDRYRITYYLGGGGAAQVFLAQDTQLGRDVAIKVLHQTLAEDARFLRRFRAEGRAVAALDHSHIVKVYDYRETSDELGVPYLVMEYLGGGNLRAVLDHGSLDVAQVLGLGIEAAAALDHAARRGVVHRDIKPANLLFSLDGTLKIADFGIARAMSESTLTEQNDTLWGTAKYMSPEQSLGRSVNDKTDVYSLALVMVEAIVGEVPFERDNPVATIDARRTYDLVAPPEVGPLAEALEAAARRDPEERLSARQFYDALVSLSPQFSRPAPIPLAGAVPPAELDAARLESEAAAAEQARLEAQAAAAAAATAAQAEAAAHAKESDPAAEESADVESGGAEAGGAPEADPAGGSGGQVQPPSTGGIIDLVDATTPIDTRDLTQVLPVADPIVASTGGSGGAVDIDIELDPVDEPEPEPRAPRLWPWILASVILVVGLIAGGTYWWVELRIPRNPVLNVVGIDEESATQSLRDLGFVVDVTHTRRDGTDPNEVISQDPEAGTQLEEGETVALTVSLGNTLVSLPELVAGTTDEATALASIEAAELRAGEPQRPFDEAIPAGVLVSAAPQVAADAGGQVPKNTVIDLVISAGPEPRRVPTGLVGQSIDVVRQLFTDVQLGVSVVEEFSDQPAGIVLRTTTAEGTEVPRDTAIEVVVSKGPELFAVPNVVGESGSRADEILRGSGFVVSGVEGSPGATVVAQDPAAGTMHVRNTAVRLLTNG